MANLKTLKEQHPNLNLSILDMVKLTDPSDTNKYMHFLIKAIYEKAGGKDKMEEAARAIIGSFLGKGFVETLTKFESYTKEQIIKIDISTIKTFEEIEIHVGKAEEIKRLKEMERQIVKWYADDEWIVLTPTSFEASKIYGKGTKWCTTNELSWNNYTGGILIYIINRTLDKNSKWAFYMKNNSISIYDEQDKQLNDSMVVPIPATVRDIIAQVYTKFGGYSCERIRKHHNSEYIKKGERYYEINKLNHTVAKELLDQLNSQKELNEMDVDRKQRLQAVIDKPEEPTTKVEKKRSVPKPDDVYGNWKSALEKYIHYNDLRLTDVTKYL
jgi:hypothetical protein